MGFMKITGIQQFDFQINRVLTYGDLAANQNDIVSRTKTIKNLSMWFQVWSDIGRTNEESGHFMHSAYAYRMAEFFLNEDHPDKLTMYKKSINHYYKAFDGLGYQYEIHEIPYQNSMLHSLLFKAKEQKGVILVCGGYDSFIEEFVPAVVDFVQKGYSVVLFEGDGQGKTLKNGLPFIHNWERPTSCVLDYYDICECSILGISWGGYLALRAAAYEKRIIKVIAYDVLEDGFDCMTSVFPTPLKLLIRWAINYGKKEFANKILNRIRAKSLMADWAIMQGMYITQTLSPYDFYTALKKHCLTQDVCDKINCDVLLLAGEKDHYIPAKHFAHLKNKIRYANKLQARMFTEAEGGEQHCQIGNYQLAIDEISKFIQE